MADNLKHSTPLEEDCANDASRLGDVVSGLPLRWWAWGVTLLCVAPLVLLASTFDFSPESVPLTWNPLLRPRGTELLINGLILLVSISIFAFTNKRKAAALELANALSHETQLPEDRSTSLEVDVVYLETIGQSESLFAWRELAQQDVAKEAPA